MVKKQFRQHKKLNDLLIDLNQDQIKIFDYLYEKYINKDENTISMLFRRSETLICIIQNNTVNYEELFLDYFSTKSQKRKLEIKYGSKRSEEYTEKLKKRERPKVPFSIYDYNFWIKKGFDEKEAKNKVSQIQTNNVKKRKKQSYKNISEKMMFSLDYWIKRGYTKEEAEILRQPYLLPMKNDLFSLIYKHGEEEGLKKWIKRCEKYKNTMKSVLCNKRIGGSVSKESLKFFIPIYKFCRRLGLERQQIKFGITGSREFFIRDNEMVENHGKFYDFTIPKLKLIIEYHGIFWHARKVEEWRNPWTEYEIIKESDMYREKLAKRRGMEYIVVWSDEDLKKRFSEICDIIRKKYNES